MKKFRKFLKSPQFKMICSIFLVLLFSIILKMLMPQSLEHLDNPTIQFKLKFRTSDDTEIDFSKIIFSIDGETGKINDTANGKEIGFDLDKSKLGDTFELKITSSEYTIGDLKLNGDTNPIQKSGDNFTIEKSKIDDQSGLTADFALEVITTE